MKYGTPAATLHKIYFVFCEVSIFRGEVKGDRGVSMPERGYEVRVKHGWNCVNVFDKKGALLY